MQLAIGEVTRRIAANQLNTVQARLLLYGLQIILIEPGPNQDQHPKTPPAPAPAPNLASGV